MNWDQFIQTKVKTLRYWLNYVAGVGREEIVNEGAIKYGIAEFFSINCDPFTFEDYHNSLRNQRRIDLTYKIKMGTTVYFNVCEFKQISEDTYKQGEEDRYFADLCRLALYKKNYNENETLKTYFLIAGKTKSAYSLLPQRNAFNNLLPHQASETSLSDWLSFDVNEPNKSFKLTDYREYESFKKNYKEDKSQAIANHKKWLRGNNMIRTRLVQIEGTDVDEGGFLVAAWEIL